ncbi:MAG: hypothetical protein AAGG02_03330 [Cyanobacteria bacterium P01_H01_bin.15]
MNAPNTYEGNAYFRPASAEEECLYQFLRESVQTWPPDKVLDDFYQLFFRGRLPRHEPIISALMVIVNSSQADYFHFILNRCCHILINYWQLYPHFQPAVPKLIDLFERLTESRPQSYERSGNRLQSLLTHFVTTDQFLKLQRLGRVISRNSENSLGQLINRYPYLYEHCLLSEDSSYEHIQTVKHFKKRIQRHFEIDMSRYLTAELRQDRQRRDQEPLIWTPHQGAHSQRTGKNPTFLPNQELSQALFTFAGPIEPGGLSGRDYSRRAFNQVMQASNYGNFKEGLFQYLTASIDTSYGRQQFNKRLEERLMTTLPQCRDQRPSESLLLRTSCQLLNFMVVENTRNPEHYVFVDLITNLGATTTVRLLLRLVLLCGKVRPYLEKRLSVLFSHYESFTRAGVPWLVTALENLHLALTLNFGKLDISAFMPLVSPKAHRMT